MKTEYKNFAVSVTEIFGHSNVPMFLDYFIFREGRQQKTEGWFECMRSIGERIGLTINQIVTIREKIHANLPGFMTEQLESPMQAFKQYPIIHYKFNWQMLDDLGVRYGRKTITTYLSAKNEKLKKKMDELSGKARRQFGEEPENNELFRSLCYWVVSKSLPQESVKDIADFFYLNRRDIKYLKAEAQAVIHLCEQAGFNKITWFSFLNGVYKKGDMKGSARYTYKYTRAYKSHMEYKHGKSGAYLEKEQVYTNVNFQAFKTNLIPKMPLSEYNQYYKDLECISVDNVKKLVVVGIASKETYHYIEADERFYKLKNALDAAMPTAGYRLEYKIMPKRE